MNNNHNHVAVFIPSLRGGGAERVMINLVQGFLQEGVRVDLIVAQKQGPFLDKVPTGASLVDLDASRVRYGLKGLVTYLKSNRPVGLLSAMDHVNVTAILARRLAAVPTRIVATLHTTMSAAIQGKPSRPSSLARHFLRVAYSWADAVVAVSQGVADDAALTIGIPQERIKVIYNPVVTPDLRAKALEPFDHPWFNRGEPPVLLSVGRLAKPKDYGLLIRAVAMLRQSRPVRLIILGEGEERPVLEKLIYDLHLQACVSLPGFVPNPYAYMRRATIFVLSSRWEGLPTVLIEAMAVGVPVISTDCPSGPFEILKGGELGTLVPVGDLPGLVRAILRALDGKMIHSNDLDLGRFEMNQAVVSYLNVLRG